MARRNSRRRKTRKTKKQTRTRAKLQNLGFVSVSRTKKRTTRRKPAFIATINKLKGFRQVLKKRRRLAGLKRPSKLSYKKPLATTRQIKKHTICENRSIRKQIMHALGKAGKGGQKKPRYLHPNIKCRRT